MKIREGKKCDDENKLAQTLSLTRLRGHWIVGGRRINGKVGHVLESAKVAERSIGII
jgi:hypothetical protein